MRKDFSCRRKFGKKQKNIHDVPFDSFQLSFTLSIFAEAAASALIAMMTREPACGTRMAARDCCAYRLEPPELK